MGQQGDFGAMCCEVSEPRKWILRCSGNRVLARELRELGAIRADYQDKEAGDIAASFASEVRPLELKSQHSRTSLIHSLGTDMPSLEQIDELFAEQSYMPLKKLFVP